MEPKSQSTDTQTKLSTEIKKIYKKIAWAAWIQTEQVRRKLSQTWNYPQWHQHTTQTQLEASHEKVIKGLVTKIQKSRRTPHCTGKTCRKWWANTGTIYDTAFPYKMIPAFDERDVLPTQFWQTVLDSLDLTHPGSAAMQDLCQYIWFPHIPRSIEQMTQVKFVPSKIKTQTKN